MNEQPYRYVYYFQFARVSVYIYLEKMRVLIFRYLPVFIGEKNSISSIGNGHFSNYPKRTINMLKKVV